jgi:lariat debranching enzyme
MNHRNSSGQQGGRSGRGRGQESPRGGPRGSGRGGGGGRGRFGGPNVDDTIEELGIKTDNSMCIAIQGCCHGELDAIYDRIRRHEESTAGKVDLLLCCGDFQALRSTADYHSLAVPPKYRAIGSFYKYYSGEKEAPVLTIFIGGNHEASQPLQELYYGGWVAPKIYYLGAAGVVNVGGVRIGGVSGIYKSHDFTQGRYERPPYDKSTMRSIYHVRNMDVYRMKSLSRGPDIMMSHDWPQGIEQHGNTQELLRKKPFFREEVERNDLGSPCNRELLDVLKPKWWFSAHLHVKFTAAVNHNPQQGKTTVSSMASLVPSQVAPVAKPVFPTEDGVEEQTEAPACETTQFHSIESTDNCHGDDLTEQMTRFLSLDKCLPRRQFLSILHIPATKPKDMIEYDAEWLAILKKTHDLTVTDRKRVCVPHEHVKVTGEELEAIQTRFPNLAIPNNFCITVPPHDPRDRFLPPLPIMGNPQCDDFLGLLGLRHLVTVPFQSHEVLVDGNAIDLDEEDEIDASARAEFEVDNNEIDLDEDEVSLGNVVDTASYSKLQEKTLKKPRLDHNDGAGVC